MRTRLLIGSLILIAILSLGFIIEPLREFALRTTLPLRHAITGARVSITNTAQSLFQIGSIRSEREALQQEVVRLRAALENTSPDAATTETTERFAFIEARVLLVGTNPLDRAVLIGVGSNQGVRVGQPVVSGGFLLGRVIATRDTSATVRLVTSAKSRLQAWVPSSNARGLLVGDGTGVQLTEVASGVSISQGAVVETSGLSLPGSTTVPAGITIGTVGDTVSSDQGRTQNFWTELVLNPAELREVRVLLTATEGDLP